MRENMQNAMTLRINAGTLTGTCIPHVVKYRAITSFFFFRSLGRIYDINSQTVRHVKKEENCHFVLKIRILDFNDLFGLLTYNHLHRPPTPPHPTFLPQLDHLAIPTHHYHMTSTEHLQTRRDRKHTLINYLNNSIFLKIWIDV